MDKIWFERPNIRDNVKFEIDRTGRFELMQGKNYASIRLNYNEIEKLIKFLQERSAE